MISVNLRVIEEIKEYVEEDITSPEDGDFIGESTVSYDKSFLTSKKVELLITIAAGYSNIYIFRFKDSLHALLWYKESEMGYVRDIPEEMYQRLITE